MREIGQEGGASRNWDGNSVGMHGGGGWDILPARAETEGRGRAWPFGEVG